MLDDWSNGMQQNSRMQKFYNTIIVLLPVLAQYSILDKKLDFDVIAMIIIALITMVRGLKFNVNFIIWLIIGYTILITSIGSLFSTHYSTITDIIFRSGKYCLYLFIIEFIGSKKLFNYKLMMIYYRRVVYAAFIYIVIQAFFYYLLGITLPCKIGAISDSVTPTEIGRLHSFYSEPADLSYSIIPFICCCLFGGENNSSKRNIKDALIGSLAIIISTSSQGLVALGLIWAIWIFIFSPQWIKISGKVITMLAIILVIVVASKLGVLQYTYGRLDIASPETAFSARNSGYTALGLLNDREWVLGTGYGNYINKNLYGLYIWGVNVYYSSYAEYLFTTGIVGTLLFYGYVLSRFKRGNSVSKVIILVFLLLSIGGSPTSAKYLPIYLSLIYMRRKTEISNANSIQRIGMEVRR